MSAPGGDDKDIFQQFEKDSDDFFDSLLSDTAPQGTPEKPATGATPTPPQAATPAASGIAQVPRPDFSGLDTPGTPATGASGAGTPVTTAAGGFASNVATAESASPLARGQPVNAAGTPGTVAAGGPVNTVASGASRSSRVAGQTVSGAAVGGAGVPGAPAAGSGGAGTPAAKAAGGSAGTRTLGPIAGGPANTAVTAASGSAQVRGHVVIGTAASDAPAAGGSGVGTPGAKAAGLQASTAAIAATASQARNQPASVARTAGTQAAGFAANTAATPPAVSAQVPGQTVSGTAGFGAPAAGRSGVGTSSTSAGGFPASTAAVAATASQARSQPASVAGTPSTPAADFTANTAAVAPAVSAQVPGRTVSGTAASGAQAAGGSGAGTPGASAACGFARTKATAATGSPQESQPASGAGTPCTTAAGDTANTAATAAAVPAQVTGQTVSGAAASGVPAAGGSGAGTPGTTAAGGFVRTEAIAAPRSPQAEGQASSGAGTPSQTAADGPVNTAVTAASGSLPVTGQTVSGAGRPGAPVSGRSGAGIPGTTAAGGSSKTEATAALVSMRQTASGTETPDTTPPAATSTFVSARAAGPARFQLSGDSSDSDSVETEVMHGAMPVQDCRPPEIPPTPANFTHEDAALRDALAVFYLRHKVNNLANINLIVARYRGRHVSHLWAALALKYGLPTNECVELLAQTLYQSSVFEYADDDQCGCFEELLTELSESSPSAAGDGGAGSGACQDRAELLRRAIQRGADNGSEVLLRVLCFRGVPEAHGLRARVWKVLLGYLPMARYDEWKAIQGEKRALYAGYRADLLSISDDYRLEVREPVGHGGDVHSNQDLLQEVQNDVDRTRRDFEYFRRPATRCALIALLFVYARLNPGVRYVQGMNEVAAVVLYVISGDSENAEADAFWCFSELMVEIKEGFMQALDLTGAGVSGLAESVARILRSYDPELAQHFRTNELPPFVFVIRWCTVLFAQDATLPDVVRLWDSFIADPNRFEFVVHVAVASILARRQELLQSVKQFELAETLQNAPRSNDFEALLRRAWAICAFERRPQTPPFPPKSVLDFSELSEWGQTAAQAAQIAVAQAQVVGAEVARNVQEHIAPVVRERAGQASAVAAVAAADGAQKVQDWLDETAPARQEALEKAQTRISSLWDTVKATSQAAAFRGQRLAAEYGQGEAAEQAAVTLGSVASGASALFQRAAAKLAESAVPPPGEDRGSLHGHRASAAASASSRHPPQGADSSEETASGP